MKVSEYKKFLDKCKHEYTVMNYIKSKALNNNYKLYDENTQYKQGDKIIFEFNKLIALVELGEDLNEGANMIISHMDSPRLDVIPNEPFIKKPDGFFCKVAPYGGIIAQSWLDRPFKVFYEN